MDLLLAPLHFVLAFLASIPDGVMEYLLLFGIVALVVGRARVWHVLTAPWRAVRRTLRRLRAYVLRPRVPKPDPDADRRRIAEERRHLEEIRKTLDDI